MPHKEGRYEQMKLWVTINEDGYLDSYSKTAQENQQEVEVETEPIDFTNWKLVGTQLVHDPKNAPVIKEAPSELEQLKQENEELRQRQDMSDEALLQLADMVLTATMKGGV